MRQKSLLAIREISEGLIFKPDFLTVQEEHDRFALLRTMPFYEFKLHGVAAKRRVLHFGLRYALESRVLSTAPEIPSQFEPLRRRAAEFAGVAPDEFSQILVNEYRPGAGIGWHHDSPAFGIYGRHLTWCDMHHALSTWQRGRAQNACSRTALAIYLFAGRGCPQFMAASHRANRRIALLHHHENSQKAVQR